MAKQKTLIVRIPLRDYEIMREIVKRGEYLNVSCFVRDAIKEKIKRRKKTQCP